jgi:O-antigen ligase
VAAVLACFAPRRQLPWWVLAQVVLLAGIAWSGSRSALLGVVAGVVPLVVLLVRTRGRTVVLVTAGVLVVGLGLALAGVVRVPVVDRLLERHDTAASARAEESTDVRFGQIERGLEQRGELSLLAGSGLRDDNPTALHNGHLEIWMGLGLVGLAGWAVVVGLTSWPALRLLVDRRDDVHADVVRRAAASGFLAYAVTAAFVDNIWNRYVWVLVALVAVLGTQARAAHEAQPMDPARTTS